MIVLEHKTDVLGTDRVLAWLLDISIDWVNEAIGLDRAEVDLDSHIALVGFDSVLSVEYCCLVTEMTDVNVDPEWFWEYSSVRKIVEKVSTEIQKSQELRNNASALSNAYYAKHGKGVNCKSVESQPVTQ